MTNTETHEQRIEVYLSDEEYDWLKACCESYGVSESAFCRALIARDLLEHIVRLR
jgi:hypothetical protein